MVAKVACRSEGRQQSAHATARSPKRLTTFSFSLACCRSLVASLARGGASSAVRPAPRDGGVGTSRPIVRCLRMMDAWTLYRVGCTCMYEYILYIVLIFSFIVLIYRGYAIQNDWYRSAMVRERTVGRRSTITSSWSGYRVQQAEGPDGSSRLPEALGQPASSLCVRSARYPCA